MKNGLEEYVFLWSYNGQYPVAEIKGATYAEVSQALGVPPKSLSKELTPKMDLINSLRTKLPKALINTYTYRIFVGVESMIDPSGKTTTYQYDSSGRLWKIKDHRGRDIEVYQYNYLNK